jgi:cytidylate kinase
MYRAIAWLVHERDVEPENAGRIMQEIWASRFEFGLRDKESFVCIDGVNPEKHLKDQSVNRTVSLI